MPRARLSRNGPEIARPGYDVDTAALENIAFAPQWVAARVWKTVDVTVQPYAGDDIAFLYDRHIETFGRIFPTPPIIIASGLIDTSNKIVSNVTLRSVPVAGNGWAAIAPSFQIFASNSHFELYVRRRDVSGNPIGNAPAIWRCTILENSMIG